MKINKKLKIAVLGLGVEGKDVVNFLIKNGFSDITVFDKKDKKDLDLKGVDRSKVIFVTGANYLDKGLLNYKIIFRSPGVYRYLPQIIKAENNGSVITSNIKLFLEDFKGLVIGVTGTKGKGTTSSLIYNILKTSGKEVYLAGNIGHPPLSILDRVGEKNIVILELSSFQLIDMDISPDISVILNITNDHMDWHKNQKEYIDAKKNIVLFQDSKDYKVINSDYKMSKSFSDLSHSKNYFFSKNKKVKGVFVDRNEIYTNFGSKITKIGATSELKLRGEHNWENVCAAICASYLAGADYKSIKKAVFAFGGLEHRLEFVRNFKGMGFYNDSFSTNPQTTTAAINSFSEPITLILGGYDKGLDFNDMVKSLCEKKNIANIILIGDVEQKLYMLLKKYNFKNIIKMGNSKMKSIVNKCIEVSNKDSVVLLSPACASFDMFKNYKDRGNQFVEAVKKL